MPKCGGGPSPPPFLTPLNFLIKSTILSVLINVETSQFISWEKSSENGTTVPLLEMKSHDPNGTKILKVDPTESQSPTRKISKYFKLDRNLSNGT